MSHQRNGDYRTPKDEWQTPQWLFDLLDQEFHFNFDAACNHDNAKCAVCSGDSLDISWVRGAGMMSGGRVFLNPPYSAGNIDKFMAKALEESQKGAVVVCLVPCATDTRWWHQYAMKAQEIRFIKGRVRFVGYDDGGNQVKNSPTFSSCVVIFDRSICYQPEYQGSIPPMIGKTIERPKKVKPEQQEQTVR